ncbi:DUF2283 domain-containing protein [Streptomyces sp. NPDC001268]|uniref:DUF2283 domain-containing protein n=1 Tax=Streptomyces sp. NPDC001268 TaxID=3364553 RepID=UPI00368B64D1
MINLDFDEQGRLIGIEVLAASSKLPEYLLESAGVWTTEVDEAAEQGICGHAVLYSKSKRPQFLWLQERVRRASPGRRGSNTGKAPGQHDRGSCRPGAGNRGGACSTR